MVASCNFILVGCRLLCRPFFLYPKMKYIPNIIAVIVFAWTIHFVSVEPPESIEAWIGIAALILMSGLFTFEPIISRMKQNGVL